MNGAAGLVNLEGPVAEAPSAGEGVRLHNAPRALGTLRDAGIVVAGVANNHAFDAGDAGPGRSVAALRAAGMNAAGLEAGEAIVELAGKHVAFTAHDLEKGVPEKLSEELTNARSRSDVLVATFHVTGPPSYVPRPELRDAVERALASGARVIAAHGTHAVGPVERRGDAVIAWGLGNLLFSCDCTSEIDGALLRVSIAGGTVEARIIPIDAGLHGAKARPSHDAPLMLDLLEAIGSTKLDRDGATARF